MITSKETGELIDPAAFRAQMAKVQQSLMVNMKVDFDARTVEPIYEGGSVCVDNVIGGAGLGISVN